MADTELTRRAVLYRQAVATGLGDLSDGELNKLLEECSSKTNSNCSWCTWGVAKILIGEIAWEHGRRRRILEDSEDARKARR